MRITRRSALKGLSATALAPLVKGCPAEPEPAFLDLVRTRIKHVVVVMMENRSFDHYFGAMSLNEGRTDIEGLRADMSNPNSQGLPLAPHAADVNCVADPPHSWEESHAQWADGACSGFVTSHERHHGLEEAHRVMGYWDRSKLTTTYKLAETGALCQHWYASVMGPTWPNRFYLLCGSSHGLKGNEFLGKPVTSLFNLLDQADIGWKNYYGNLPFSITLEGMSLDYPEMQRQAQFFEDAAAGTLPPFVLLDPIYGKSDDHPPTHPVAGQVFLQTVYQALANSPHWESSLLVVTYDEHGGFFDHVSPPTVPDDFAPDGFDQLGFRVPSFVVGPYVKNGVVSNTIFDHTSVIKTICDLWNMPGIGARDRAANSLLELLDVDLLKAGTPRAPEELPAIEASDEELFADECRGFTFHAAPGAGRSGPVAGITGQPELEALAELRFPGHEKNLHAKTDEVWADFLAQAEQLGTLRRRR